MYGYTELLRKYINQRKTVRVGGDQYELRNS